MIDKDFKFKFGEDEIIKELEEYIRGTYGAHYVGENNIQSIEYMDTLDAAVGFCKGNIIKYTSRYGKKNGRNKADLMKVLHYTILLAYFSELEQQRSEPTQPTQPITKKQPINKRLSII